MLPDLLAPNLKLVICGTAVGNKSALAKAYYAGPGNKFYRILSATGLSPLLLNPANYGNLLNFGIGLTDLVKCKSGMDHTLAGEHYDILGFKTKIEKYKPLMICFNGKKSARVFLGLKTAKLNFGLQPITIGVTKLFIAPSTSGAANGYWNEAYWFKLKEMIS